MVKNVSKRAQGTPDKRLIHPGREWIIGLAMFVVVLIVGAVLSMQVYNNLNNLESSIVESDTRVIRYQAANVETALERSVKNMMEWGDDNEARWQDYFNYVSLNRVCQDIVDGKVSPWLILNCKSGKEMVSKMNDEQLQIVYAILDPSHWSTRFKRSPVDVELVKEIVKKAGL